MKRVLPIILVLFSITIHAQNQAWQRGFVITYQDEYDRTINYGRNYAGMAKPAENGNILFTGSSNTLPIFGELDWKGDTVWAKVLSTSAYPIDVFESVDGYLWGCRYNNVFKTDKQGNFLWHKTFKTEGPYELLTHKYIEDDNGDIWSSCTAWYADPGETGESMLVVKFDSDGNQLLASEMHTEFLYGGLENGGLVLTDDGGAIMIGGGQSWPDWTTKGWNTGMLIKIDKDGKLEWQQGHNQLAVWQEGYQKNDSTYVFFGRVPDPFKNNSPSRIGYLETDLKGNRRTFKAFSIGDDQYNPNINGMHLLSDGTIRLTGELGSTNYETHIFIADIDSSGEPSRVMLHGFENDYVQQARNGTSFVTEEEDMFLMVDELKFNTMNSGFTTFRAQYFGIYYIPKGEESCFFTEIATDDEFIIPTNDSLYIFQMDSIAYTFEPTNQYWTNWPKEDWSIRNLCAIAMGEDNQPTQKEWKLFPNPTNTGCVRLTSQVESIILYDLSGKEVARSANSDRLRYGGAVKPGVYIAKIFDGTTVSHQSVAILR